VNNSNDYIEVNRESWNQRTAHHINSPFYDVASFLQGESSLHEVELNLLGDVRNKSILHLQCHFGQDSLSLSRLGAKVTGVDFSDLAIEKAREFNTKLGQDAEFICTDIYELPEKLNKRFDIVFTSYGTIGWLPDMDKWAAVVSAFLKPGGKFIFVEFHPVIWMFDNDFTKVEYSYFNKQTIVEEESGTYADREAPVQNKTISWNHSLGEVISALIKNSLQVKAFEEYDYSPYDCFRHCEKIAENKYRIKHLDSKIPMLYSLLAEK